MDEILQIAKRGGFKYQKSRADQAGPSGKFAKITMNAEFWKGLGKMMQWDFEAKSALGIVKYDNQWIEYSKEFHEINLTQNWSKAVEYLEELVRQSNEKNT